MYEAGQYVTIGVMTNLQGGITSSQLSPQAFKNSSQSSSFQDTFNSQNQTSSTSNQSLLYATPSATKLKVDVKQSSSVLGASFTSSAQNQVQSNPSNNFVPLVLIVLVVSIVASVYFLRKFSSFATKVDALDSSTTED